jgi:hypothetical protein
MLSYAPRAIALRTAPRSFRQALKFLSFFSVDCLCRLLAIFLLIHIHGWLSASEAVILATGQMVS